MDHKWNIFIITGITLENADQAFSIWVIFSGVEIYWHDLIINISSIFRWLNIFKSPLMMVFLDSCRKDDFSEVLPAKLSMVKVTETGVVKGLLGPMVQSKICRKPGIFPWNMVVSCKIVLFKPIHWSCHEKWRTHIANKHMAGLTHADHAEIAGMQLANHHDSTALNASAHQRSKVKSPRQLHLNSTTTP